MGSTFNGPVNLLGCWFWIPPDFRGTVFKKHVSLHGIAVDFRLSPKFADADIYRRLKEIAFTARDHDCEQLFFAYELKAKRRFEAMDLGLISNYLYEWTSNFGRSLTLPSFLLVSTWFIFGILYRWLETANTPNHIWDGLSFSTEQLFLFLGASKGASSDSRLALYSEAPLSIAVNALAMTEGVLGIIFIFLIGLALRNRFRI